MSTILLKNIYKEGELDKDSTCKEYLQVAHERAVRNEKQLLLHVVYIIFCSCINCEAHMAMSILQIRVDDNLKNEVSDLFERLGMDIPTAVRMYLKAIVRENGLPIRTKLGAAKPETPADSCSSREEHHADQERQYNYGKTRFLRGKSDQFRWVRESIFRE